MKLLKVALGALLLMLLTAFVFAHYDENGNPIPHDPNGPKADGSGNGDGTGDGATADSGEGGGDTGEGDIGGDAGSGDGNGSDGEGGGNGGQGCTDCDSSTKICCGGRCIDRGRNKCISNTTCPLATDAVCGGKCYNTSRFACWNKKTLCRFGWSLCDGRCYDPSVQFCGGGVRLCNLTTQWYCPEANRCYNNQKSYCCATSKTVCPIASLKSENNTCCPAASIARGCNRRNPLKCGTKCYNPDTSSCYSTVGSVCAHGAGICGTRCFNTTKMYCPDNENACRHSELWCPEAKKCYNPRTHSCCQLPGELCPTTPFSQAITNAIPSSYRIELGWVPGIPETKVGRRRLDLPFGAWTWVPDGIYVRSTRIYGYLIVTVTEAEWESWSQPITKCAGEAALAAGIAALITKGALTWPTFRATFAACLRRSLQESFSISVSFTTEKVYGEWRKL